MERINIFLSPEDKKKLEAIAKRSGLNLSQLIRLEMKLYLERLEQKKRA